MAFTSVTYISKILWRFYGASSPAKPEIGIRDIQHIFQKDKIVLEPYYGPKNENKKYIRQVIFEAESSIDSMTASLREGEPEKERATIYAEEPKAVCFCDIPINHLALHMAKYNCVGIGINREKLIEKAIDLQPVKYYFIRSEKDFEEAIPGVFTVKKMGKDKTIKVEEYVKIPTLFVDEIPDKKDGFDISEPFNTIYEEREWRHTKPVELTYDEIAFLLLPSKSVIPDIGKLKPLLESNVGIIYADELFPDGDE